LLIMPVAIAFGWRIAFLVTPVLALIWLILWLGTVKTPAFTNPARAQKLVFPNVRELRFWSLVASYALGALPVGAVVYLAPLYLSRAFGMTAATLGHVLWIPPAGLEAGFFFWGWIADRFAPGNPRPAWLFGVMSAFALPGAAITSFHSAPAAIALLASTLFASAGFVVVALRTGALAYKREQRSMAAGIASSSFSAAVALAMPLCGRLFDAHLYSRAFLIVAMAPLAGTVIWYLLPARHVDSRAESESSHSGMHPEA
jgi:ACS family hexuronate transporter-like MFS transporter